MASDAVGVEEENVIGAIHLVRYADGSVEYTLSGCFKKAPGLLAEAVEKIEAAARKE